MGAVNQSNVGLNSPFSYTGSSIGEDIITLSYLNGSLLDYPINIRSNMSFDVILNNISYGEDEHINASLPSNATGQITFILNNLSNTVNVVLTEVQIQHSPV
ncbi:MAG: hypothetical protein ACOX01_06730 [Methanobrevibacter boviskoreani]|jgi:hypothetical protein|uniref:hypothetical protein n=1 Tax=Methanobrevibacter boviskoreani TaxID=1348249 RepID=UPI000594BC64|nr:hypothetical protein [Methanobrevibacter boviskoreani]